MPPVLHYAPSSGRTSGTQYIITSPIVNIKRLIQPYLKSLFSLLNRVQQQFVPGLLSSFKCVREVKTNGSVAFHMVLFLVMAVLFGWLRSSSQSLLPLPCAPRGLVLLLCCIPPPGPACGAGDEYHHALHKGCCSSLKFRMVEASRGYALKTLPGT